MDSLLSHDSAPPASVRLAAVRHALSILHKGRCESMDAFNDVICE